MAQKGRYTPPKKKIATRARAAVPPPAAAPAGAGAPVAPTASSGRTPEGISRTSPRAGAVAASVPASVKYASLPRELGWLGLLSLATIALLFILWLVFR
jgi:hypothetical protein